MFLYDTLIAPLTKELNFTQTLFGMAMAAVGAGGVIGALLFGIGTALFFAIFFLSGFTSTMVIVPVRTIIQRKPPPNKSPTSQQ